MNFSDYYGNARKLLLALFLGSIAILSCQKPLQDLELDLSNEFVAHQIDVQIVDAREDAPEPYPSNPVVTLSGEAVALGLVYNSSGNPLNGTNISAEVDEGGLGLAIKPYTKISPDKPLRFTINVRANGYLPATKEVVVTDQDSLQYLDISMVNLANAPEGVSIREMAVNGVSGGLLSNAATFNVFNKFRENKVAVSIPAGTEFRDAAGKIINSTGNLSITAAHFDNSNPESVNAIPGGLTDVVDTEGNNLALDAASAVDITAILGTTAVKSFSKALKVVVDIDPETINPNTGALVKTGDELEVWSADGGSTVWRKEGMTTVFAEGGKLKAIMNVNHLSVWVVGSGKKMCQTKIIYKSNTDVATIHLFRILDFYTKKLLSEKKISLKNGDTFIISLPSGKRVTLQMFEGQKSNTTLAKSEHFNSCTKEKVMYFDQFVGNPRLYFDLATKCTNGTFRYTGPIDYKLSGTKKWYRFTPSHKGTLATRMLDWNKKYDFRITYKKKDWTKSRVVLQSEFRKRSSSSTWDYWGRDPMKKQTFFNAPTKCTK